MAAEVLVDVECEFKELPLDCLTLGKHQARTRQLETGIADLALNIRALGLLQPIVVCPDDDDPDMYFIVAGQRRFLAHRIATDEAGVRILDKDVIMCRVYAEPLNAAQQVAISYAENAVRNEMVVQDHQDVCANLYQRYGTFTEVARVTGLPVDLVSKYVKFDRLAEPVKEAVRSEEVSLAAALQATQAVEQVDGEGQADPEEVLKYARRMNSMTNAGRRRVVQEKVKNPEKDIEEVIGAAENAKSQQMVLTFDLGVSQKLEAYAASENQSAHEAAEGLVRDGLVGAGFAPDSE